MIFMVTQKCTLRSFKQYNTITSLAETKEFKETLVSLTLAVRLWEAVHSKKFSQESHAEGREGINPGSAYR